MHIDGGGDMKILFICELFYPHIGGCEVRFYELGKRLVRKGHTVNVLTIKYSPNLPEVEKIDGMMVYRIASSFNYITGSGWRSPLGVLKYSSKTFLHSVLKSFDFHLIFSNQWPILHSLLLAPLYRDVLVQDWAEVWVRKIFFLEKLLGKLKYHVAVSKFTKERMKRYLGISGRYIFLVPNGIDVEKYYEGDKEWGTIAYVGRFSYNKRIDLLIKSFLLARKKCKELKLFLAGSGILYNYFKEKYSGHGIEFLGKISEEEKRDLLAKSWLFLLTSEREGYGISVLEALASGTPVILADFPDNAARDLLANGGGIIEKPSPKKIAERICKLYRDVSFYEKLQLQTRSVAENYSWDRSVKKLEDVFRFIYEMNY